MSGLMISVFRCHGAATKAFSVTMALAGKILSGFSTMATGRSMSTSLSARSAELALMSTQGVDRLRALPDQQLTDAEDHEHSLSLFMDPKHIVSGLAAPEIVSAFAAAFFWRMTKGSSQARSHAVDDDSLQSCGRRNGRCHERPSR